MKVVIKPSEIATLAPMPASVVQLASMANDPKVSILEMSKIIEFDEALTANLLKLANSVWGGSRVPVVCVKDAVVRLGTAQVLKFAVGRQVAAPMREACPGYNLAEHELWRHSVAAALAAEHLSKFLYKPVPGLAFTASLMHDIGKLLLSRHIGHSSFLEIQKMMDQDKIAFIEAEHRMLGTDHAVVGGEIAKHWKFPPQLVGAIELHHQPDLRPDALLDVVYIADDVAKFIRVDELSGEEINECANGAPHQRLGVSASVMEVLCGKVQAELEEAEKLYMGDNVPAQVPRYR